jgi:hypothetical protein
MRANQLFWSKTKGWSDPSAAASDAGLVLYFGSRQTLTLDDPYTALRELFPDAHILGCSTGGHVVDDDVSDEGLTALALRFETTALRVSKLKVKDRADSFVTGGAIGAALRDDHLAGIFVLSDGLRVDGSALARGISEAVGTGVPISGGMAADGTAFVETLVGCDACASTGTVAAIGFYGTSLQLGHGIAGGWHAFGPERRVTRSAGNVIHELDGKPALDVYMPYLSDKVACATPGSTLMFPLRVYDPRQPEHGASRMVLSVDEAAGSLVLAGDVPQGWSARIMWGGHSRLSAGAAEAARMARAGITCDGDLAAIIVSCVGRRMLMGQSTDAEIEAALGELGENCQPIGFYSYGEIAPAGPAAAMLHNQSMSVTVLGERAAA